MKVSKKRGVDWSSAPEVKKRVIRLVSSLGLSWIKTKDVYCIKSKGSKSRAYARIWGFSKVWQLVLKERPKYVIEILEEKFNKLPANKQDEVLIHELAHIPKNFSGSLLPHIRKRGKRNFNDRVRDLIRRKKVI